MLRSSSGIERDVHGENRVAGFPHHPREQKARARAQRVLRVVSSEQNVRIKPGVAEQPDEDSGHGRVGRRLLFTCRVEENNDMTGADDIDLTEAEQQALHELQLGVENLYRGYGSLLDFHHAIGRGMDHLHDAEEVLREAGHEKRADMLRDETLPTGVLEDKWTYEIVESFGREFLAEVSGFEQDVREELADGTEHITERRQQQSWRERAEDRDAE